MACVTLGADPHKEAGDSGAVPGDALDARARRRVSSRS